MAGFSSVTFQGFPYSKVAGTKLFLQDGDRPVKTPASEVHYLEVVNFTPPAKGRGDPITFPVPSSITPGEVLNRRAADGSYDAQTLSLSMYLSSDLREGVFGRY